jgi:hypothetical protein
MDASARGFYASAMPEADYRFYYLENFRRLLDWLSRRYEDLLAPEERRFTETFSALPLESAALLVRMITRRGDLFRSRRLVYAEIGCPRAAAGALIEAGLIEPQPPVSWTELQRLLTRLELAALFEISAAVRRSPKSQLIEHLQARCEAPHALSVWSSRTGEAVYRLSVAALCERLRIVFFGNFRQDWSEFVLTDLGIYRYETVDIDARARPFRSRAEIDQFCSLYACREQLQAGAPAQQVLEQIPAPLPDCEWIEARRQRLVFHTAQQLEKAGQWSEALAAYLGCNEANAQMRAVRVLERQGLWQQAWDRLSSLDPGCSSEPLRQLSDRMRRRLGRKLGCAAETNRGQAAWPTLRVELPRPDPPVAVETLAAQSLATEEAPVFYVENALLNSLLGLWCWEAIFAPVPGAFFHPFQAAPADLLTPEFRARRAPQFAACHASLESGEYRECIVRAFREKTGLASPFVTWDLLTPELLELALECISAEHLGRCFERILADLSANRAGLPDLIQFFPRERRYRLIEVKGPGDRLQNNQLRWLGFCVTVGIEVAVCKVSWEHSTPLSSAA